MTLPTVLPQLLGAGGLRPLHAAIADPARYAIELKVDGVRGLVVFGEDGLVETRNRRGDRQPAFRAWVEMLDPARIVVVVGPTYWSHAERGLGLGLASAPFPLIRAGRVGGRTWVVGYHPTYSRQAGKRLHGAGTETNAYYVATVKRTIEELER